MATEFGFGGIDKYKKYWGLVCSLVDQLSESTGRNFRQISPLLSVAVGDSVRNFAITSGDIIGNEIRYKKLVSEVAVICSHGTFASGGGGGERGGGSGGGSGGEGSAVRWAARGPRETEGLGRSGRERGTPLGRNLPGRADVHQE